MRACKKLAVVPGRSHECGGKQVAQTKHFLSRNPFVGDNAYDSRHEYRYETLHTVEQCYVSSDTG